MKKLLFLLVIACCAGLTNPEQAQAQTTSSTLASASAPRARHSFITNWSPKEYGGTSKTGRLCRTARMMYSGNSNGVLEYDDYLAAHLPSQSIVGAFAGIDRDGRIYVGGETEISYLLPDSTGEMQYVSLMTYVPKQYRDFADVWQTLATRDGIYFSSRKYLFRWRSGPCECTR
jgi:hypothetical protein